MTAESDQDRWVGRPGQAKALRTAVVVAPLVTSIAVVAALSRLVGPLPADASGLPRLLGFMLLAVLTAAATERLARRLLPLSILLELSMLFPDRAPSRWAVARRAQQTTPADLLKSSDEDAAGAAVRILALMGALAAHDRRTRGHAERVRAFTDLLAVRLDMPRADRDKLRWAALLHDIGKLGIEPSLLNKPSRLDTLEWEAIKRHPVEGQRLAGPLLAWLGEWGKAIVEHHERYDGSGYPMGLAATGISRAGRIVGVVDAYETMTAARAYKKAFATREARAELARCAGSQFDPTIVRAFLAISLPRLLWASGALSFLVQLPFLRVIQEAGVRVASVSSSVAATTTAVAGAAVLTLPVAVAAGPYGRSVHATRPADPITSVSVLVGTLQPSPRALATGQENGAAGTPRGGQQSATPVPGRKSPAPKTGPHRPGLSPGRPTRPMLPQSLPSAGVSQAAVANQPATSVEERPSAAAAATTAAPTEPSPSPTAHGSTSGGPARATSPAPAPGTTRPSPDPAIARPSPAPQSEAAGAGARTTPIPAATRPPKPSTAPAGPAAGAPEVTLPTIALSPSSGQPLPAAASGAQPVPAAPPVPATPPLPTPSVPAAAAPVVAGVPASPPVTVRAKPVTGTLGQLTDSTD